MLNMKNLLEGYAWERKAGEPLPNMKTVQQKYQKNLEEKAVEAKPEPKTESKKPLPQIDMAIVEALTYFGFTANEAVALKLMMQPDINLKRVKALYENEKLPEKAATREVAAYLGTDAVLVETYDASKQEAYIEVYHMYKDGKLDKDTFYKFMDILEPEEREELKGYIATRRDSEMMEEAEKREKAKKYPRWQDTDGDGKWYEAGDDVSEGEDVPDLGRLNMSGNLDESKFWGRTKGNLNGHDYILRETFRK